MTQQENKSICLLPWDSVAVRPFGTAIPCCRFVLENTIEFAKESRISNDFRNSPTWVRTREMMLAGEKTPHCFLCYREEDSGAQSMRTFSIINHLKDGVSKMPTNTDVFPLKFLEIAFSNLCNLACISCNRSYSSTWASEDYKNGRLPHGQKALIQHNVELNNLDLSHVDTIKIIGGEPFMDQDRFIDLLNRLDLKNLTIRISTNGTVLPNNELKLLMDQCKNIVLDVSLDGINSVAEWYRWPTKFSDVRRVMDQYQEWWGDKPNRLLQVHSLIHIYNIWDLDTMIIFLNENYPSWGIDCDWIVIPTWQSVSLIPEELKPDLIDKLSHWDSTIKAKTRYGKSNPFSVSILRLKDTPSSTLEEFKEKTLLLAKERNLDVFKMVPHIAKLFENKNGNSL